MKAMELHEKAMNHSFLAKQARNQGDEDNALDNYEEAAKLESEAAEFYFDKPELEPTRSILIRSAAFLNLKAGFPDKAERYIFHGIINTQDHLIKEQLYDALELCLAFKNLDREDFSGNVDFIYRMRQKSILYVLEPKTPQNGSAVALDMISDFSDNYMKSLRGFSKSEFRTYSVKKYSSEETEEYALNEFEKNISPVVTNAGFGSFKFSLGVNFLASFGEPKELTQLKSNILVNFHDNIFIKDLSDENIEMYRKRYSSAEIDEIFRPLVNMRSSKSSYKVNYYDRETLKRKMLGKVKEIEKKKLLPIRTITTNDIGYLEQIITHTRGTDQGGSARSVILRKQLKSSAFDYPTKVIEPKNRPPIILTQEIIITVEFDSNEGFTLFYDDLELVSNDSTFSEALSEFFNKFIGKVKYLSSLETYTIAEGHQWESVKRILNNPELI